MEEEAALASTSGLPEVNLNQVIQEIVKQKKHPSRGQV